MDFVTQPHIFLVLRAYFYVSRYSLEDHLYNTHGAAPTLCKVSLPNPARHWLDAAKRVPSPPCTAIHGTCGWLSRQRWVVGCGS